jgi:hypothetical protein
MVKVMQAMTYLGHLQYFGGSIDLVCWGLPSQATCDRLRGSLLARLKIRNTELMTKLLGEK